jgi:anti-sigma factor RsiW
MNKPDCELLDAYLLGWLSAEEAAAFESHLASCAECARQKSLQARIDEAAEKARNQPEAVPPLLVARTHRRVRAARTWRLVRIACGLAAAALLVVLPGRSWFAGLGGTGVSPVAQSSTGKMPVPPVAAAIEPPRVRLVDPSSAILVPMPSENPDVTIVWVYPTWKPGDAAGGSVNY